MGQTGPDSVALAQVAGREQGMLATVPVSSLGKISGGVVQGVFFRPGACDNGRVVWIFQGFQP